MIVEIVMVEIPLLNALYDSFPFIYGSKGKKYF